MMSDENQNFVNTNFESITVKVELPDYGPMQTTSTVSEMNSMFTNIYPNQPNGHLPYKIENASVIDFIESSFDKFLVAYQSEQPTENLLILRDSYRKRIQKQNESEIQREKRLSLSREYMKKQRENETEEERDERLKKQRERIRAKRQQIKMDPVLDQLRRDREAIRMKVRRANEALDKRMIRLEKSRMYSRVRREDELYRKIENEKNKIANQIKREDEVFRMQERQQNRLRMEMKRQIEYQALSLCPVEVCIS